MSEPYRPMTLTGKILYAHAIAPPKPYVSAGDQLRIKVDWTIASELAWNGMDRTYDALGRPPIHDPQRFYLAIDHTVDPLTLKNDPRTQRLVQLSRDFAKERQIKHFYDANETILHTSFYRELIRPGEIVLGADSHTSSHGGVGAFAIGLGGADICVAMVLGETWIEVPEAIAVVYQGDLPFGVAGKDVILKTLGTLGRNTVALERSVEYVGEATAAFSTDMRFTICNMTAEFGGLNGIFTADAQTQQMIEARGDADYRGGTYLRADDDAPYVARYQIDLDHLEPQVAKPFAPDNVFGVSDVLGTALDGAFIGACTTTEEELVLAALVLEQALQSQTVSENPRRLVVPGNRDITERLAERGLLEIYQRAGFRIGPPGCSMCLGIASDRAGEGEVWLSSQNRNFHNRMGKGSMAWLSSAATVAASAPSMSVSDPRPLLEKVDQVRYARLLGRSEQATPLELRYSEPIPIAQSSIAQSAVSSAASGGPTEAIRGRVQRFGDHVDTDAIIPGEFCHLTDHDALGKVCFHHVRPEFFERSQSGQTIVVAGEGWGSGSSREQAVWALKGAGIRAVIAKSFAFIHKRNLVNEALPYLLIDDAKFYELAAEGVELIVDVAANTVEVVATKERFSAAASSPMVAALARETGIVPAIRRHGKQTFSVLQGASGG
ncbi:MAG: 3-isopropylmalate dehydratase [Deltaproteobacteria bacterium]|nr:3-isopropylmalate dehydratase [Deltaproteobacteria bacterium]